MNEQDTQILNDILKKNPEDLSGWEKDFLKARRTYLTNEQKRVFESILIEKEVTEVEPPLYISRKDKEAQEKK